MGNATTQDAFTRYEQRGLDKLRTAVERHRPVSPRPWHKVVLGPSRSRDVCDLIDADGNLVASLMFGEDADHILAAVQHYDAVGEAHDALCETDR